MADYTKRWAEAAEAARRKRHAGVECSLWGKNPLPPRGPMKLLDLDVAWFAKFSTHELTNEATGVERKRTLDFFIAERDELTEEVAAEISSVVMGGKRFALAAAEPRHELGEARYWQIICVATGEDA